MAISFDAKSLLDGNTGATHTISHTCTGSNLLLTVVIRSNDAVGDVITGTTYNGVAMTLLFKQASGTLWDYFFYLLAPSTGANNIVASASNAASSIYLRGTSFTGVAQTGFPDASAQTTGTGTTATGTVTTVADNCWLVGLLENNVTNTVTAGANTTIRNATSQSASGVDSNGLFTPAGTYSLSFSWVGSGNWSAQTVSIKPFVASTVNSNFLAFM